MQKPIRCEHRNHVKGKGWVKCTFYASRTVVIEQNGVRTFKKICGRHFEQLQELDKSIGKSTTEYLKFPPEDICPECGSPIVFEPLPLCSGNHEIGAKLWIFLKEKYTEYFQPEIQNA